MISTLEIARGRSEKKEKTNRSRSLSPSSKISLRKKKSATTAQLEEIKGSEFLHKAVNGNSKVLGDQLTLISHHFFISIPPKEFIDVNNRSKAYKIKAMNKLYRHFTSWVKFTLNDPKRKFSNLKRWIKVLNVSVSLKILSFFPFSEKSNRDFTSSTLISLSFLLSER